MASTTDLTTHQQRTLAKLSPEWQTPSELRASEGVLNTLTDRGLADKGQRYCPRNGESPVYRLRRQPVEACT